MKGLNDFLWFPLLLLLGACGNPAIQDGYALDFPVLPEAWQELLGAPRWRLIWIDEQGFSKTLETDGDAAISTVAEWAAPALAFPYWPDRGIFPGEMRPAGAVIPFDIRGGRLQLSWRAGAEAWFYRCLTEARNAVLAEAGEAPAALDKRRPEYFDWPRFRDLMENGPIPAPLREDPWKADWQDAAARMVRSGFDRRRILERETEELILPQAVLGQGPFAGPSPFAEPLFPEPDKGYSFPAGSRSDTYISAEGILRINRKAWVYYSFDSPRFHVDKKEL
jgi:hypothetical protein